MKFEIHYSIGDYEDYLIVEGDTISDIIKEAKRETESRGLEEHKNNLCRTTIQPKRGSSNSL